MNFKKIEDRVINSSLFRGVLDWSKESSLPGFQDVPVYDIVIFIYKELQRDGIVIRANSMAFSFFLSLFPSLLFLVSLLPFLPLDNFVDTLNASIFKIFPDEAANFFVSTILEITGVERQGVLGVSLLLALFFSSNGVLAMMRGFNKQYDISYKSLNFLQKRGKALWLTFLIGFLILLALILLVAGGIVLTKLFEWAHLSNVAYIALSTLRWFIVIGIIYMAYALIYHIGPSLKVKLRFFSSGASLATLLTLISSLGFSFFVNNFGRYNEIYGSISALIIVLLFIQINAFILLIGHELNASIAVNRDLKLERKEVIIVEEPK